MRAMTISNESDLERLREIGGIAARVLDAMGRALEPGMTTRELDGIGRKLLDDADAQPAPELDDGFPGGDLHQRE
jgi:methionyl aminopeptidase